MIARANSAEVTLPADGQVEVTRSFNAPRTLVYEAYTKPDLMRRWLVGYPGWTMPVCEMDVRIGGTFRWRWQNEADESEFGFHGEFLAVETPSLLRHTQAFDPGTLGGTMGDGEAIVTVTFTEDDKGVTTVSTLIDYGSNESRDAALSTGMTDGMEQSYQLLDELLAGRQNG